MMLDNRYNKLIMAREMSSCYLLDCPTEIILVIIFFIDRFGDYVSFISTCKFINKLDKLVRLRETAISNTINLSQIANNSGRICEIFKSIPSGVYCDYNYRNYDNSRAPLEGTTYIRLCNYRNGKLHGRYLVYGSDWNVVNDAYYINGLLNGISELVIDKCRLEKYINGVLITSVDNISFIACYKWLKENFNDPDIHHSTSLSRGHPFDFYFEHEGKHYVIDIEDFELMASHEFMRRMIRHKIHTAITNGYQVIIVRRSFVPDIFMDINEAIKRNKKIYYPDGSKEIWQELLRDGSNDGWMNPPSILVMDIPSMHESRKKELACFNRNLKRVKIDGLELSMIYGENDMNELNDDGKKILLHSLQYSGHINLMIDIASFLREQLLSKKRLVFRRRSIFVDNRCSIIYYSLLSANSHSIPSAMPDYYAQRYPIWSELRLVMNSIFIEELEKYGLNDEYENDDDPIDVNDYCVFSEEGFNRTIVSNFIENEWILDESIYLTAADSKKISKYSSMIMATIKYFIDIAGNDIDPYVHNEIMKINNNIRQSISLIKS